MRDKELLNFKTQEVRNKVNRDKIIKLSYSKNDIINGKAMLILNAFSGQYAIRHSHIAAKELEYILEKNTDTIITIRDYCVEEIRSGSKTQRVRKLEQIFFENPGLYGDLEPFVSDLYKIVDEYEQIDLTKKENLESFCKDLKNLPIFNMINISHSNGALTAFMQNMRNR